MRIFAFDLLEDFSIIQFIQFLVEGLRLKNIGESKPDDTETSQKSRDEAHPRVERAGREGIFLPVRAIYCIGRSISSE